MLFLPWFQFCWTLGSCPSWARPRLQRGHVKNRSKATCWTGPPHQLAWRWEHGGEWCMWVWIPKDLVVVIYIKTNHGCKLLIQFIPCTQCIYSVMYIHAQICSVHPWRYFFLFFLIFIPQQRQRQGLRLMWLYLLGGLWITTRQQWTAK